MAILAIKSKSDETGDRHFKAVVAASLPQSEAWGTGENRNASRFLETPYSRVHGKVSSWVRVLSKSTMSKINIDKNSSLPRSNVRTAHIQEVSNNNNPCFPKTARNLMLDIGLGIEFDKYS